MSIASLSNLAIVLVNPLIPENIGAACRAMKNMGLSDLRLVHPPLDRGEDARKLAHGAEDILDGARRVFTVDEALDDVQFVVGTTARLGGWRQNPVSPRNAAPELAELLDNGNKVAILFGSEDRGLSNEAIRLCQMLISIPTSREHSSLNLAQAVLLIGYELFTCANPGKTRQPKLALHAHVEAMFDELSEALEMIHFLKPGNPDYWMMAFKRLFGRVHLETREVNMLRGVCRQIRWVHSLLPEDRQPKRPAKEENVKKMGEEEN
jgi:tRNA/rRNA methyltransferase